MPTFLWQSGRPLHWSNMLKSHHIIIDSWMISGGFGNILIETLRCFWGLLMTIMLPSNWNPPLINSQLIFLDTTTFKGPNFPNDHKLDVKVFFKPTDTHALLFRTSFHPKNTFAGIIKSQLLRFHRICTQQGDFGEAVKVLFSALSPLGGTVGPF